MSEPIILQIIAPPAAPNACGNTWEKAAQLVASRIIARYPGKVTFSFVPLFSKEFFAIPQVVHGLQNGSLEMPIILVGDRIVQAGGKISESKIRMEIDRILNE